MSNQNVKVIYFFEYCVYIMETATAEQLEKLPKHHKRQKLCTTRAPYRQGRNLTAVKVYTIANESQHLLVYGVPTIKLRTELKSLFSKYGTINKIHVVNDVENEAFTECYHVHYHRTQSARIAKRSLDDKNFYGGILHVCYAPEYETIQECRYKLLLRNRDVLNRLQANSEDRRVISERKFENRKRKHPAWEITEERMRGFDQSAVWKNVPSEIDPRKPQSKVHKLCEPKKHYQMKVGGVQYGPHLPEAYERVEEKRSEDVTPLKVVREPVKFSVEKKIVFRR